MIEVQDVYHLPTGRYGEPGHPSSSIVFGTLVLASAVAGESQAPESFREAKSPAASIAKPSATMAKSGIGKEGGSFE